MQFSRGIPAVSRNYPCPIYQPTCPRRCRPCHAAEPSKKERQSTPEGPQEEPSQVVKKVVPEGKPPQINLPNVAAGFTILSAALGALVLLWNVAQGVDRLQISLNEARAAEKADTAALQQRLVALEMKLDMP